MAKAQEAAHEHEWQVLHEVREIQKVDPTGKKGLPKGDVGTEFEGPYRKVYCHCGETEIVPFTPEELQIVETVDNVRVGTSRGTVTKERLIQ